LNRIFKAISTMIRDELERRSHSGRETIDEIGEKNCVFLEISRKLKEHRP